MWSCSSCTSFWLVRGLLWRRLTLVIFVQGAQFQCRLFPLVQALIFGALFDAFCVIFRAPPGYPGVERQFFELSSAHNCEFSRAPAGLPINDCGAVDTHTLIASSEQQQPQPQPQPQPPPQSTHTTHTTHTTHIQHTHTHTPHTHNAHPPTSNNNNNTIWGGSVSTSEEPPLHSGELKHALPQAGGPTQSQLSRPMSSGHHISTEHRLQREQLNSDTNASNKNFLKEIQGKRKEDFFLRKQ